MGSKKYIGKTCVYCAVPNSSQTGDHVFARELFLKNRRNNLPKVPACKNCNLEKSQYEHYLATLWPMAGRHEDAHANIENNMPGRLANNRRLHQRILRKTQTIQIEQNGVLKEASSVPFEGTKMEKLFTFVVRGLIWFHWKTILTNQNFIRTGYVLGNMEKHLHNNIQKRSIAGTGKQNFGNGTFIYEGFLISENPHRSIWKFLIYGGLMVDLTKTQKPSSEIFWGIVGALDAPILGKYDITYMS